MTNNKEGSSPLYRIVDANLNRLKEGIRVCEDIFRYHLNDSVNAYRLKDLRHEAFVNEYEKLLLSRDIKNDPLKATTKSESKRSSLKEVFVSNMKRAQESARVLEEVLKISDAEEAEKFKKIRYELYDVEKEFLKL